MKKYIISSVVISFLLLLAVMSSCTSARIASKSGTQLWGENCIRCHNAPSPKQFDDRQWSTIVSHMQITANLTQEESEKIITFLQSAN